MLSLIRVLKTKRCRHCGHTGTPRREGLGLVWLAALMWLVPVAFLSFGFWPFFLFPAIALSAWACHSYRECCAACGAPLD